MNSACLGDYLILSNTTAVRRWNGVVVTDRNTNVSQPKWSNFHYVKRLLKQKKPCLSENIPGGGSIGNLKETE